MQSDGAKYICAAPRGSSAARSETLSKPTAGSELFLSRAEERLRAAQKLQHRAARVSREEEATGGRVQKRRAMTS
ncbi:hypothetical protein PBY51_018569 [Eleginops maclovinus]|uniref:Uncharacterized protein n=1 Tax=Eleginops maclovinus TaxID=56733 RepID=A0AAN7Y7Z4_ELEMC|nr:hypothetical protein PBY51_018569 [Eleginops maclovinus]